MGRLPVQNRQQARRVVSRLMAYAKAPGSNTLTWVADDADYNLHLHDSQALSQQAEDQRPDFIQEKIYLDAAPQLGLPPAQHAPQARRRLLEAFEGGRLLLTYTCLLYTSPSPRD